LEALRTKYNCNILRSGYGIFKGYTMPISYEKIQQQIHDFEVYDDDIWVTSFPKAGTTWTQELVWCLKHDVDLELAKRDLDERFPFIDFSCVFELDKLKANCDVVANSVEMAKNMKRPRFIKSHVPWELLPKQIRTGEKKPKIIHVARNPMDTVVSYYHHSRFLEHYKGDFELFKALFLRHKLNWSPYSKNILSYWNRRDLSNLLFIKFEDMKRNLPEVVTTIATFLDVELSDAQMQALVKHTSFEEMKKNVFVHHTALGKMFADIGIEQVEGEFIREGKIGGYTGVLNDEDIRLIEKEILSTFDKEGLHF